MPLTQDAIASLYAKRRVKGQYEADLMLLLTESDEPGVDVKEDWAAHYATKTTTTLQQGFNNAAKKLEVTDQIDVIQNDDHVYILVKSRINLAADASTNGNGSHADTEDDTDPTEES